MNSFFIIEMRRGWGGSGGDFAIVTKTPVAVVRPCFPPTLAGNIYVRTRSAYIDVIYVYEAVDETKTTS